MESIRTPQKRLLQPQDLALEYALGRDLSYRLCKLLPHVSSGKAGVGQKLLVPREHLETLLIKAQSEGHDLWALARRFEDDPEGFRAWLAGSSAEAA